MKKVQKKMRYISLILYFSIIAPSIFAQEKDLLSSKYSVPELQNLLIPSAEWTPFPHINDREGWANADKESMQMYLDYANKYLDYNWPTVPATLSLRYVRTGNRHDYQDVSYKKRSVLASMVLAEIAENKGRFIDPIVNGIWSICEESWWGAAAHLPNKPENAGLMDVSEPFVDLYSAATASVLALTDYFLGEKLDSISPQLRKRIHNEVQYRVLQPLMNRDHRWMWGTSERDVPNNWNPWICSNWMVCALLLEKDETKRAAMIARALKVLDAFINPYPQDGGCDEGAGYWNSAVGSLYDDIYLLNTATNGAFRYMFDYEKIQNMGRFLYRMQISEKYVVNFADAPPHFGIAPYMVFRFGKDINDPDLMKFGAYYQYPLNGDEIRARFICNFMDVFLMKEVKAHEKAIVLPQDVWLPDIQIATARDKGGSSDGLFFAAKGGHNGESHNHNDVGNFLVYYDGLPLLIDVGSGKYTSQTFSARRYEIWNYCSDYHNTPTINGVTQNNGVEYKATNLRHKAGKSSSELSLDISGAYPPEAAVNSWNRTVCLNRNKDIVLTDVTDLKKADSLTEHLMTCYPATVTAKGEVTIYYTDKDKQIQPFVIKYNDKQMVAEVEKIKLETLSDQGVLSSWGDVIHRINFKVINPKLKDTYRFIIKKI